MHETTMAAQEPFAVAGVSPRLCAALFHGWLRNAFPRLLSHTQAGTAEGSWYLTASMKDCNKHYHWW